jgi:hypothetical protein
MPQTPADDRAEARMHRAETAVRGAPHLSVQSAFGGRACAARPSPSSRIRPSEQPFLAGRPRQVSDISEQVCLAMAEMGCSEDLPNSSPIGLTHTPTTRRMLPVAGIKLGIGRRLYCAGDAEQRAEGIERVEAPVEAKRKFVEVGL